MNRLLFHRSEKGRLVLYQADVRSWQILLQKSLATSVNGDSVSPTRFAMEAVDDGAAEARSGGVFLFIQPR